MANPEILKAAILTLLKGEVRDLWEVEDEAFLEQLATDIAREKLLAASSPNPAEHLKNLEFLAATLEGEVVRKKLKLNKLGRKVFVRVVVAVIKTMALPGVGIII